jgi:prepilin signal peptidase PulO-like enzyme (type II secretory pathway)
VKQTASRTTRQAFFSMFGPFTIANIFMLAAIVVFVAFQPDGAYMPSWAAAVISILMLVALAFIIKGGLRLRNVRKSAGEDRRRHAAGLPLDPEDQRDADK